MKEKRYTTQKSGVQCYRLELRSAERVKGSGITMEKAIELALQC
jgi:hypothetical protein